MNVKGKKIGIGISGSFCTISDIKDTLRKLKEQGADLYPVISSGIEKYDTRFAKAKEYILEIEEICGRKVVNNIVDAEPFGPKIPLDVMVMLPITGGSLSKMANGINDTPPLLAAKATLRNLNPVVIAVYTNDALGLSGTNIFKLLSTKNFFFVPFGQDDFIKKPNSMVADTSKVIDTIEMALERKQIQPVIIENFHK